MSFFKSYYIKCTKNCYGDEVFSIYKKYFGLFSVPFKEFELVEGFRNPLYHKIYRTQYMYSSLEKAKNALIDYLNEPTFKYKNHTLHKCHGNLWVDMSISVFSGYREEYKISGCKEVCKVLIDRYESELEYEKFKKIYKIYNLEI